MEGSALLSRSVAVEVRRGGSRAPFVQRYWAFLSYSHADNKAADWLHRALERFCVPKSLVGRRVERFLVPAKISPVFRDRSELAAADCLSEEIEDALECSRHLIVLCSPAAARSRWVDQEIRTFKRLRSDGEVLAAIVAGEPWASRVPGREGEECFPPALREEFDDDGQPTGHPAEPIAADLRAGKDGRELGLLKIVAGMLDVRLDELVQRDEHRRQRRMIGISAASIAGMVAASGLAVTAIQSRDAARDQRREAESLVSFMVGDLTNKLDGAGSLQALDAVGTRVTAYYERQDESDLSDEGLAQRSKALTLLGDIAQRRGDFDGALRLYRAGLNGTAEALRRDPDNPQRLFDHAQNVFWIGELARQTGDSEKAEAAYRQYKVLADRMVELDSANPKWRLEVLYATTNLGIALEEQRQYADAAREFSRALEIDGSLAQADPANAEYGKNRLEILAWLADARFGEGRLQEAIRMRQEQLGLIEQAKLTERQNMSLLQKEVPARRSLGRMVAARGDMAGGLDQLNRAAAVSERLVRTEPENMIWMELAAGTQLDLGGALLAEGSLDEAERAVTAGCAKVARLEQRDERLTGHRALEVECLARSARVMLARRSPQEALVVAGQALAAAQSAGGGDPAERAFALAMVYRLLGDIHQFAGARSAALDSWRQALAVWPAVVATPRQKAVQAELLSKAGRQDEATALRVELDRIGYRRII